MNLAELKQFVFLPFEERLFLEDFVSVGWVLFEVSKNRSGDEFNFRDSVTYHLGAEKDAQLPESYQQLLKAKANLPF